MMSGWPANKLRRGGARSGALAALQTVIFAAETCRSRTHNKFGVAVNGSHCDDKSQRLGFKGSRMCELIERDLYDLSNKRHVRPQ